nr:PREDICTED: uncharacterized protein LOC106702920 [Latimeria chalumnae]|eukprot:XP_014342094.1 PREDICTED: uncharacterized protein LOC106702920 [Latimeria chalumnae]
MKMKDLIKWNVRVSLVYAVGIWTTFGAYGYFRMKRKREEGEPKKAVRVEASEGELTDELVLVPATKQGGLSVKTTVVYKEDFVPYTARLYRFVTSLISGTADVDTSRTTSEK